MLGFEIAPPLKVAETTTLNQGTAFDEMKLVVILNRLVSRYSLSCISMTLRGCVLVAAVRLVRGIFLF